MLPHRRQLCSLRLILLIQVMVLLSFLSILPQTGAAFVMLRARYVGVVGVLTSSTRHSNEPCPPSSSFSVTADDAFGSTRPTLRRKAYDSDYHEDSYWHNTKRTDILNFLTQRSLQSFIFLCESCRDPHTITWLERKFGWTNLENFHGTGALNLTLYPYWDSLLEILVALPPDTVTVRTKKSRQGRGRGSNNRHYLDPPQSATSKTSSMPGTASTLALPSSLSTLGRGDYLSTLGKNEPVQKQPPRGKPKVGKPTSRGGGYLENMVSVRKEELTTRQDLPTPSLGSGTPETKFHPHYQDQFVDFYIDMDPVSLSSRLLSVREQLAAEWVQDLGTLVSVNDGILTSYRDRLMDAREEEELGGETASFSLATDPQDNPKEKHAFVRNAQALLTNSYILGNTAPSPLRQGNFDLLILLATQEAVHRVLREYRQGEEDKGAPRHHSPFEWLAQFYTQRVATYFDGSGPYQRSEDFLEELLTSLPSVLRGKDDTVELIDTLRIAEDVVRMRSQVALDWKEVMGQIPQHHVELRRQVLAKQMERWGGDTQVETGEDVHEGEFE